MATTIASSSTGVQFQSSPLSVEMTLMEQTGVPNVQQFDAASGTNGAQWVPDYALTPLTLAPVLTIGGGESSDLVASLMAEGLTRLQILSWSVIARDASGSVKETVITSGSPADISFLTGSDGKKLSVSRNVNPAEQISIRLRARYTFMGCSYDLEDTFPIRCVPASEGLPKLYATMPAHLNYDPLRDKAMTSMTFELRNADGPWPHDWGLTIEHEVPDATGKNTLWQVVGLSGSADENITDGEFDFTHNTATNEWKLEVDRSLMDEHCKFRARAWYKLSDGTRTGYDPTSASNPELIPQIDFEWIRHITDHLKAHIQGMPRILTSLDVICRPTVVIEDSQGLIPEAAYDELAFQWRFAVGKADGSVVYANLCTGRQASFPASKIDENYGARLEVVVSDRGPYALVVSGDSVLTDSNGNWIKARI